MSKDTTNPLQPRTNGAIDDIAAVVGFTAALRLCAWYGCSSAKLYVPHTASEDHDLARLIGMPAFERLVREWGHDGADLLALPNLEDFEEDRRYRQVRDLLRRNLTPREIGPLVGLSERRIQQVRMHLENAGMLSPERPAR